MSTETRLAEAMRQRGYTDRSLWRAVKAMRGKDGPLNIRTTARFIGEVRRGERPFGDFRVTPGSAVAHVLRAPVEWLMGEGEAPQW